MLLIYNDCSMKFFGITTQRAATSLAIVLAVFLIACSKTQQQTASTAPAEMKTAAASSAVSAPPASDASTQANPSASKPDINGNHVMQYVKEVVAIGSRPVGSPGHAKLEQYILAKLKGDDVEQDKFT